MWQVRPPSANGVVDRWRQLQNLRDVGEVIVDVLTCNSGDHENLSYDLTGPELLTFAEIADRFSEVLGRRIEYVDQPMDEFKQVLRSIKMSEWRVEAVCKELEAIAAGVVDHTTDTIGELLGRPATSLTQFVEDHVALFK